MRLALREYGLTALLSVLACALIGCAKDPPALPTPPAKVSFSPKNKARSTETTAAARKAMAFVKPLDVAPWNVRKLGMKGHKHFVEKVQLYRYIAEWPADPALANEARKAAVALLALVRDERFHTLTTADDKRFSEDSMSYLRALWLARRFGFAWPPLKARIEPLLPRFAADSRRRGFDQRMAIAFLLTDLGFSHHETPEAVYPQSRLGSTINPAYWQQHPSNTYDLTHEIFAMTHRGARPLPFLGPKDQRYADIMTKGLLGAHMKMNNPDIAAELLINRVQLQLPEDDATKAARAFLLAAQNDDGSFGAYDEAKIRARKKQPTYDARIGGYLHTTMVCVWALMETS